MIIVHEFFKVTSQIRQTFFLLYRHKVKAKQINKVVYDKKNKNKGKKIIM